MQIKTIMSYHLTPVKIVVIKTTSDKCKWGCGGKGIFVHFWWECKLLLQETVLRFLKKLEEPSNQVIPLLGIHPKEMKFVFKISALQWSLK